MVLRDARELENSIKAGAPLPVYLLYGEESYRIEKYTRLLEKTVGEDDGMNLCRYDGRALPSMDTVADSALSLSFSMSRKCVVIDDIDVGAMPAGEWEKLCELLEAPEENTLLVITARTTGLIKEKKEKGTTAGARGEKLLKLCEKQGAVCEFPKLSRADAAKYATALATRTGCVLEREDAQTLADYCACDLQRICVEMEKLLAYSPKRISRADIDALVAPAVEANVFRLSDLLLRRDFGGAMELIDDLLFLREAPAAIISMLSMAYSDMYKAAAAAAAGKTKADSAKGYGMSDNYRYDKAWEGSRKLDIDRLGAAVELLAEAERAVKSQGAEPRVALETAVAGLARV